MIVSISRVLVGVYAAAALAMVIKRSNIIADSAKAMSAAREAFSEARAATRAEKKRLATTRESRLVVEAWRNVVEQKVQELADAKEATAG